MAERLPSRGKSCLVCSCLGCGSFFFLTMLSGIAFVFWLSVPYPVRPLGSFIRPEHDLVVHLRPGPSKPLLLSFLDELHGLAARHRARRLPPGLREFKIAKDRSDFRNLMVLLEQSDPSCLILGLPGPEGTRQLVLTLSVEGLNKPLQLTFDLIASVLPDEEVHEFRGARILRLRSRRRRKAQAGGKNFGLVVHRGHVAIGQIDPGLLLFVDQLVGEKPSRPRDCLRRWKVETPCDVSAALDNRENLLDGICPSPSTSASLGDVASLDLRGSIEGEHRLAVTLVVHGKEGVLPDVLAPPLMACLKQITSPDGLSLVPGDPLLRSDGALELTLHVDGIEEALKGMILSFEQSLREETIPSERPIESR